MVHPLVSMFSGMKILWEEETPEVMKGKDSEKGSDNTISDSSSVSNGTSTTAVNNKKGKRKKKSYQ